jgi:hypothetical protein
MMIAVTIKMMMHDVLFLKGGDEVPRAPLLKENSVAPFLLLLPGIAVSQPLASPDLWGSVGAAFNLGLLP